MAFHLTAADIRLRDGHILVARLDPYYWDDTEIDLDEYLGNINGIRSLLSPTPSLASPPQFSVLSCSCFRQSAILCLSQLITSTLITLPRPIYPNNLAN
jgi:hypothetical protein